MSSLTLVDANTYLAISPFDPIASGATINLATLPTQNLTIRANTSPATVGSVKFNLVESAYLNTVNTSPYYMCGSVPCSNLGVGLHSLTTTPYMASNASGAAGTSMSISFSVIDPTPTPTPPPPTATPTPAPWPSGVPTPAAIPPIPALKSPITVGPGTFGVVGNGTTDDTAAWQTRLNTSDVIVLPGTYAIAGNLHIPTGRNIQCQSGATFLDTQSKGTTMFLIGGSCATCLGNNSIVGCTFEGTDTPAGANNYANYLGGTSGYSELLEIASGWGIHIDNVLIENNTFRDGQGDNLITYSPCGTANTGAPCNGGAPGTEGPSNITIYNNTLQHCAQPGIHINGGQNVHVTGNTTTDCNINQEMDTTLQVMTGIYMDHNTVISSSNGQLDPLDNNLYGVILSCATAGLAGANGHGCWALQNTVSGCPTSGRCSMLYTNCPGTAAGYSTGNYYGNSLINGTFIIGCAPSSQLTVPYCNGGTCTTTGWLQDPPVQ